MSSPLEVAVFDVNETLSDLTPLATRFTDVGAPAALAPLLVRVWFASVLREGIALAVTGEQAWFADIGADLLGGVLDPAWLTTDRADATSQVMDGFTRLPVHPDVVPGVRALAQTGLRLVTLSNGAAGIAERLLGEHGLRDRFERVLSVEDAGVWKPHPRAYAYAASVCGTDPARMLMVAVHPWDLHGAARSGMRTAWIDRAGSRYPAHAAPPTYAVDALTALPDALAG
jgi:2-haloacid dehalogenase